MTGLEDLLTLCFALTLKRLCNVWWSLSWTLENIGLYKKVGLDSEPSY